MTVYPICSKCGYPGPGGCTKLSCPKLEVKQMGERMKNSVPTAKLEYVEDWLDEELRMYVYQKFSTDDDSMHVRAFSESEVGQNTWWDIQLHQYLDRAKLLGLDTPNGRQALGKYVATAIGMLVAAVGEYGELPRPGVPSGQNLEDLSPL